MPTYLLYLNLWGTTAKLAEGRELGPSSETSECQQKFLRELKAAPAAADFKIVAVGDQAYVTCANLEALIFFAAKLFGAMFDAEKFWPVRGAIGSVPAPQLEQSENFFSATMLGPEIIELAKLEKSSQKGSRLFLVPALAEEATSCIGSSLRDRSLPHLEHAEINWFHLLKEEHRDQLRDRLRDKAFALAETGTNYGQQMAGSLLDLIKWSEKSGPPR